MLSKDHSKNMPRLSQRNSPKRFPERLIDLAFLLHILIIYPSITGGMFVLLAKGHRLTNSQIKETDASSATECIRICLTEGSHCKSINFWTTLEGKGRCGLNNKVYRVSESERLVVDETSSFWQTYQDEDVSDCSTDKSCAELYNRGVRKDGIYAIDPDGQGSFDVRCDMTTDGGGWTVFQRRMDGSVDFYRDWVDYKKGFGGLSGEFWLGLEKINRLTKSGSNIVRFDLEDFTNQTRYAIYDNFTVAEESEKFKLTIGSYSGDAGDSFTRQNGMYFSTKDVDNDISPNSRCAVEFKSGWWHETCHNSNLNGLYHEGYYASFADGINWRTWKGYHYSLRKTEMKTRLPH